MEVSEIMSVKYYIKQPWVQVLIAIVVLVALGFGIYFWGKSAGRRASQTEFDERQTELLKKSQEADARAEKFRAEAEAAELYAGQLKEELVGDRKVAAATEQRIEAEHLERQREINDKYEKDKTFIASDLTNCVRCNDLCERANRIAALGPEFERYRCNADSCTAACADPAGQ